MNHNTKSLFEKAMSEVFTENHSIITHESIVKFSEVFSRLIVNDCLRKLDETYDNLEDTPERIGVAYSAFVIAKHFKQNEKN